MVSVNTSWSMSSPTTCSHKKVRAEGTGARPEQLLPCLGEQRSPGDTGPAQLTKANMRPESHSESALLHKAPWALCLGSRTSLCGRQVGHSPANPASPPAPLGCWSGSHTDLLPAFCLLPLILKFVRVGQQPGCAHRVDARADPCVLRQARHYLWGAKD